MSKFKFNLLDGEYILFAPNRFVRPDYQESESCPFCEGSEYKTPSEIYAIRENSIINSKGWKVRVVPNLYKALKIEERLEIKDDRISGFGAHEIIIDNPRHLTKIREFSEIEYFYWLKTIRDRVADLRGDIRLIYFSIFKNQGREAGATQSHPHTQILAIPFVPQKVLEKLNRLNLYHQEKGESFFNRLISKDKDRVIFESSEFALIVPDSGFPFELNLVSKRFDTIIKFDDTLLKILAKDIKTTFELLYDILGDFDFNIIFDNPPQNYNSQLEGLWSSIDKFYRFNIRIIPRVYKIAGFELSTGIFINPIPPKRWIDMCKKGYFKLNSLLL